MHRRQFLQTGVIGSAALAAALPARLCGDDAKDPWRGLKMGVASYSLRMFPLDQAIAMTKELGVKYICLKDAHLKMDSTKEVRQEAHKKVTDAGLILMSCGVVDMPNRESTVRNAFQYAKDASIPTIVCSPAPDALDLVEKMVKEFDIRIAIHNHGPTDKKFPSPLGAFEAIQNRDPRMGICIDVGHTVRLGEDPVSAILRCGKRLYDFHMKDVSAAKADGKAVVIGKGVINIRGVLQALLEVKMAGLIGMEYEVPGKDPLPGMKESMTYLRETMAKLA
jgi:inosose dehydratase